MDYNRHYFSLINNAIGRTQCDYPEQKLERHHIVPRSLGGPDSEDNIVLLTIREHRLAHLLLFNMGYDNQIFSVAAICQDVINKRSHRYRLARNFTRYIRRKLANIQSQRKRDKQRSILWHKNLSI